MKDMLADFHFIPDGSTTLADAVCAFIKDEIAYGRIKAGEPIPTIKELAAASGLTFSSDRIIIPPFRFFISGRFRCRMNIAIRSCPRRKGRICLR